MADQARMMAFEALDAVLRKGAYSNLAIKKAQNRLENRDKAFAVALFYGTLEKLITIDFILSKYLKKSAKAVIKNILRIGIYQIYFMNMIPDHAACMTSCDIAGKLGKDGAVGFINGVLRNAARDKDIFEIPDNIEKIKRLSIKYSFPEWLINKWINELGEDEAVKLISYEGSNNITLYANSIKGMSEKNLEDELKKNNVAYKKNKLDKDVFEVNGDIFNTSLFENGEIALQGVASYLASKIAVEESPDTVLDICAAPGGKTAAMAKIHNDAKYTACDIKQNRVDITKKQFDRLGVRAKLYMLDATKKINHLGLFNTVLCDVPCSALGNIFVHPEIRYNKSPKIINDITIMQKAILQNASNQVAENGRLIYSTCTISNGENFMIVDNFLKTNNGFCAVFPSTFHGIIENNRFDGCGVQLLPHKDDTAGFYIACLQRLK